MSQSFQWKSQGGINRRPVANVVRSSNTFGTVLNAQSLGQKYTTMVTESDVRADETSAIYNFDDNEINFNNVICYYPFNNTTEINSINNQSLANNLQTPKPFTLNAVVPSTLTLTSINYTYNDSIKQNVLQFPTTDSKVLATTFPINKDNAFNSTSTTDITTAFTISCFVNIKNSDISTTAGQSKHFCLFAMDDLNQTALQNFSSSGSTVTGTKNLLYLWYPNKNGKAQLLYGYKSQNAAQSWSYINKESPNQIPTDKWTQVILVLAGISIYVIVDGIVVITSSGSEIQGASSVPDQPFNINLGPYYYDYDTGDAVNSGSTNTATPQLSDCKLANWAVDEELASAAANPGQYGHQYTVDEEPNKEGLLYYLLSKDLCSFSTPTLFRSALNLGGDLQSYGSNNFYGKNNFYTKVYFADGFITDGSSSVVVTNETGNVFIDSSTPVTTQKNSSLIINNSSETGGNDFMASMLVYNYVTDISNVLKSDLPNYTDKLQFSISGENISVGHGFGDSSFNVFGDSVMDGSLSLINNGVLNVTGPIEANGGINTTVINSNIINVFDKLDVSGINFTNGYIGISQDTTTGPIRIGNAAGNQNQGNYSVAIGNNAGNQNQGNETIAIGRNAGFTGQLSNGVAMGNGACEQGQGSGSVAIGQSACNAGQGSESVAIGYNTVCAHDYSVALGKEATTTASNQIVLGTATETVKIPGQLDVVGDISSANITIYNTGSDAAQQPTLILHPASSLAIGYLACTSNRLTLQTDSGGSSPNNTLNLNNGNVGIGTLTPITTLEVIGDISANSFIGNVNGNAATATALKTARTIGGVSFDGTANIDLPGVNIAGNQNTIGNAATATAIETARTIGGVSFNGTANIDLPGVNTAGNQNTSGNAATATALQTARTIGGVSFDGTANIDLPGVNTAGNQNTTGSADTVTNSNQPAINSVGSSLGIGTTSPTSNLDVVGTGNFTGNLTVNNPTGNSALIDVIGPGGGGSYVMYGLDTFTAPTRSGPAVQIRATDSDSYAANLSFWTAENTPTAPSGTPQQFADAKQRMTITTSGNVGIGTDSPATTLEVVGDISATSFIGNITGNITGNADTATKISTIANSDIVQLTEIQTLTNKTLTSPTITGNITGDTGSFTGVVSAATPGAGAPTSNLATIDWVNSHTSGGGGGWNVSTGPNEITAISGAYKVIIGTGFQGGETSLVVTGITESTSFNSTSDVRLKENITNLDNSLDKICNIRGVNYNWKNDETKTKTAGVIAQEVLEQIPEAVNDNDSEKLSVNYNSIIAHLIESVKELKREIDELKSK